MHAPSADPTSTARPRRPARQRGLGAIARHVAVDLTPQAVEQVANRVALLLQRQQHVQEQAQTRESTGMLTVTELARHLNLNRAWVYEHADELGAIRISDGPKARLRFDLQTAKNALTRHRAPAAPAPKSRERRRPQPSPYSPDAPLLEIRRRDARPYRSCFAQRRPRLGSA
jgi:hypothetical protein